MSSVGVAQVGVVRESSAPRLDASDRLLAAATEMAGSGGYASLTVKRLIAAAGVSRATFYQYFANVDDCFWSAHRLAADRLVDELAVAVAHSPRPELCLIETLVGVGVRRPCEARLLMREALAAGGLLERHALIARIESVLAVAGGDGRRVDVPLALLIGGVFRFLTMCIERGGVIDAGLRDEMLDWAEAFARPAHCCISAGLMPPVRALDGGRGDRSRQFTGTSRERILNATAVLIYERGYRACSVAEIVALARVSRRTFYNAFDSKAAAAIAAYERGFSETMAACAPAFFSATGWPEQVWQSALAFTRYFAKETAIAYIGFVECYAVGGVFPARVHDTQLAFTMFLEGDYRQRSGAPEATRTRSALTAAAIAEAGLLASLGSSGLFVRRLQPIAVYLALTPSMGSEAAGRFVVGKLTEPRRRHGVR